MSGGWRVCAGNQKLTSKVTVKTRAPPKKQKWVFFMSLLSHSSVNLPKVVVLRGLPTWNCADSIYLGVSYSSLYNQLTITLPLLSISPILSTGICCLFFFSARHCIHRKISSENALLLNITFCKILFPPVILLKPLYKLYFTDEQTDA